MAKIPATERFAAAIAPLGFVPDVVRFGEDTRTAEQAAAAVECDVAQIVKSLVFFDGDEPVLVLTSGANRVDGAKVSADLRRGNADDVRSLTGFAIGGTPPFGHLTKLRTIVDESLLAFDKVWAAAGAPDSVFPIDPKQLVEFTDASVQDVAEA